MKRKTLLVTIIFFLSTLIQVISNIVLTRLFGTSVDYSLFLAAVTLPTIIVTVIYGTLNDALLPVYGEKLVKDKENADDYFNKQLTTLTLLSIAIAILFNLLSPFIMVQLFGKSELSQPILIRMFMILNLSIPFATFVTILGMRLYAQKQYTKFPLAQTIGSIVNLALVLILFKSFGAWGLVYSFVLNIIAQIFFVLPKNIKLKIGNIAPMMSLWLPLVIGILALKSDGLIVRTFSAQLPAGYIIFHNLIYKVCSLSAGLITIGIQVLFLPNIIERLARKDYVKTKELVNKVKIVAIILSIILALSIYFIAPVFIKLLFVGGKFTLEDYSRAVVLIPYYLIPVFGWGIISVFLQPLYALKKHMLVGILNLFCFAVAWIIATNVSHSSPSLAISVGLSVLLLGSALGSEIIWQFSFNKLSKES